MDGLVASAAYLSTARRHLVHSIAVSDNTGLRTRTAEADQMEHSVPDRELRARGMGEDIPVARAMWMCLECKAVFAAMKFISTFLRTGSGGKRTSRRDFSLYPRIICPLLTTTY